MTLRYGWEVKLRAANVSRCVTAGKSRPLLSVISSSASRPSYKGWAPDGYRRACVRTARSDVFLPISLTSVKTTNQHYLVHNEYNTQSVNISIDLADNVEDYSNKGIFNNICLTSNVSVILCVPCLTIKDNRYTDIDTVTEPMQCKRSDAMAEDTNHSGAFKRVDEDESQRLKLNKIDDNIYCAVDGDRAIGDTPNCCIPVMNNAITVQGISYGVPHSSSFNLSTAPVTPQSTDKSDYAFKTSVCINEEKSPERRTGRERGSHDDKDNRGELGMTFEEMLACCRREEEARRQLERDRWGFPVGLRLCGGGESSGWGSPPAPANNATGNWGGNSNGQGGAAGNPQQQWNNTNQRPPTSQPDSTPNSTGGNSGGNNSPSGSSNGNMPPGSTANTNTNTPNSLTSTTKIEQLNSMRDALYSQDGWGGQHVNQDTNWDVPGSPEPGVKMDTPAGAPTVWKPVNNGTDLWEANLRNGGQPTSQPTPKTPWGHTPTTNIGGTWGEDDDATDAGSMWSGPPPQQQWPGGPPQQPQPWAVTKKDDWGAWGEPQVPPQMRYDAPRPDPRPVPPDPRHEHLRDIRSGAGGGISGRLNGDMWAQHHPNGPAPNKMMPGGSVNQWGVQGPKDPIKGGWEEPSPPAARRAAGFDDGTSLWSGRPGVGGRPAQVPPTQQRGPPVQGKPDVWGQPPRNNASWDDGHGPAWPEREAPGWPDAGGTGLGWHKKQPGPGGWPDEIGEWGGPKPPPSVAGKQITKEALWASKQFRVLCDMGYKKEEVEMALRRCEMNTEEALELLSTMRGDSWRRGDDHFAHHGGPFPHQPPPALSTVSPAVAHKILNQPPQPPQHHHHPQYNHPNSGGSGNGQPSASQLRMLVQQIQMAVSAGYLNHQILNQPLAPQTLVLLNQLLQQIKALQQLVSQHQLAVSKNNSTLGIHCTVQITKAKQQISNLQNQIAAQQAIYVKQQTGGSDLFKAPQDPLSQLQNNLSDMNISKDSQSAYGASGSQQSRLNQWKLPPSLDKEGEGSEFSRAPGTAKSATSPQLNLALQSDSTWGRSGVGEAWGESGADVSDGKDAWPGPAHQAVYDLVPEFEPGKPWKMKNVEDDPAMTPGSVVRSPLSLATIKDADMLGSGSGGKCSPPPANERSLSSSTWSYPQPLKPPADAWAANKTRAPPPGLNKPAWPQQPHPQRNIPAWQSTWLLLKNLTAQIDGSTLKTLCMQHGPLQSFHLYLNQGIALARYSSREEASKAQTALNNCVLSNTTIFAESPQESEVQMILQHLGQGGGGGGWRNPPGKDAAWGFPSLWSESHDQRSTPSSLNSFLPPDLLGGESI